MSRLMAALVALAVAAAVAAPAEARSKRKRASAPADAGQSYTPPRNADTYKEFLADKLPYGSSEWWRQMDREGRGGQSRAN